MSQINLQELVKDRIKSLKAYHVDNFDTEIKLHANENSYPLAPDLIEVFRDQIGKLTLNRYPDPECGALKDIIAKRLNVSTEQLVIGNGSDELLQLLVQVFCDPGEAILFPDPTFAMYGLIARGLGVKPVAFPLNEEWDFEAETLLQTIEEHNPRILFFSYPNNPTGNCFNPGEILKVLERYEGLVVLDEAYYDFAKSTFLPEMARHSNLVILRSLSKIGLAGLRVGYGVAPAAVISEINKIRLPYNSNMVSQVFSETVLSRFHLVEEQIGVIIEERHRLQDQLGKTPGITTFRSDANFILFRTAIDSSRVFQKLAQGGILVRDLGGHPRLKNCLRVTVGMPGENNRFLETLGGVMQTG